MEQTIIKRLKVIVGDNYASDSMEERICYSYDAAPLEAIPEVVVKPANTEEVSKIVRLAYNEGIPIVPRGSGTGFVGGSIPISGGIALSMLRMNSLIEIDEENFLAIVSPGLINYELQQAVTKKGLFYPPDPASYKISTIGGNVAMCAGGPRAVKYGVTKDYVLGMEVVLPTGDVIDLGVKTLKGVVGYDLTKLMVGSEGTLGVITKVTLKLIPKPAHIKLVAASFPSIYDSTKAVVDIKKSKIIPSSLEFMDRSALRCVEGFFNKTFFTGDEAVLLIEVDGEERFLKEETDKIQAICKKNKASHITIAKDETEREGLWMIRRGLSPALGRLNKLKINEDITVPVTQVPDLIKKLEDIGNRYSIQIVNFGHAGDGNIHVNVMIEKGNSKQMESSYQAVEDIFDLTINMGGTISGEHGVGISKRDYIHKELAPATIELMKGIKKLFDPKGIMNPGKIFP